MNTGSALQAWHFISSEGMTGKDGIKVEPGQTMRVEGKLDVGQNSLHAARRALDALYIGSGPVVCRVEISGEFLEDRERLCARERKCLWMADATKALFEFACRCAERALAAERNEGRDPDPRVWAVLDARRAWLKSEATEADLAQAVEGARTAFRIARELPRASIQAAIWTASVPNARIAAAMAASTAAKVFAEAAEWKAVMGNKGSESPGFSIDPSLVDYASQEYHAVKRRVLDEENAVLEEMLFGLQPEAISA